MILVSVLATTAVAKDPPHISADSASIAINNSIINIDVFGEAYSCCDVWLYPDAYSNVFYEGALVSYGTNSPVYLSHGTVHQAYPATGNPDVWYDAVIGLDLDGDGSDDVNVTRSIMVPSYQKYFLVRYCIENIKGADLNNLRFFQGIDYDVAYGTGDEGGYDDGDFVWEHDLDDGIGTYVGFKADRGSDHHSVDYYEYMWDDLEAGSLNDADHYADDVGVGLEWDLGTLRDGETVCLTIKFAFADSYDELRHILVPTAVPTAVPALTTTGIVILIGILSVIAMTSIRIKQ